MHDPRTERVEGISSPDWIGPGPIDEVARCSVCLYSSPESTTELSRERMPAKIRTGHEPATQAA